MSAKPIHWRMLRIIFYNQTTLSPSISTDFISERLSLTYSECVAGLSRMASSDFSDYGAWVYRTQGKWAIQGVQRHDHCTGGYMALEVAKKNVHLDNREREWSENVRSGMDADGNETEVTDAVVPLAFGDKRYLDIDPENKAMAINERFANKEPEPETNEKGEKMCPRCPDYAKRPVFRGGKYCQAHKRHVNYKEYRKNGKKRRDRK